MDWIENILEKTENRILRLFVDTLSRSIDKIEQALNFKGIVKRKNWGEKTYEADLKVEKTIVDTLLERGYEGTIFSEEGGKYGKGGKEKTKILLDPLDGSTNAVLGHPMFAIMLAHSYGNTINDVEESLVFSPSLNRVYWGVKGEGAYLTTTKETVPLSTGNDKRDEGLIDVVLEKGNPADIQKAIGTRKLRHTGSLGLSICFTAEGVFDGVVNIVKRGKIVDVAAPFLILKEAGGCFVTDIDDPLRKPSRHLSFIATRDKEIKHEIKLKVWTHRL